MIITLEKLKDGDQAVVQDIKGGHGIRQRLSHLGLHPQDKIEVIRSGYVGGPVLIKLHGMEVGIGHGMAEKVEVEIQEQK
jgi:Fe2+ transport system protein FeoA